MNFFEHQAQARRSSGRLLLLFALAVIAIVLVVAVLVLWFSGNTTLALWTVPVTVAVIGLASLHRVSTLRGGGEVVAAQMGGVEVPADTVDPALRRLRNVVEEIAIASGVPMPRLYVLEQEPGINAFAAGYSPADAAIAVTRGTLVRLNRDELQGVIAHEFSHILNGDMRLNIRLMGVLFGILMISVIGRRVLMHMGGGVRGRSGRTLGPVFALLIAGLAAMAIGSIGVMFGRLIKAAVSRQREVLADASAVQFTRQTQGLAGALKKIGGLPDGSRLADRAGAEEVSHMLFGEGMGFSRWFATHPPLLERIQRLEPSFSAVQLKQLRGRWAASPPDGMAEDVASGLVQGNAAAPPPLPADNERIRVDPAQVAAQVATPGDDDYRQALQLAGSLPDALRALARDRDAAPYLLLALLRDTDPQVAARQQAQVRAQLGEAAAACMDALADGPVHGLHAALRLPLATLAFPALRAQPRPWLGDFLRCVDALAHADGRISLFEYCLSRLLQVQVQAALDPSRHLHFGRRKTSGVRAEFATLLAVVAWAGNPGDEAGARRAYLAGLQRILPRDHLPYAPPANGVLAMDAVWAPLDALDPLAKQLLVESVAATVSHDQRVSVAEAELLRTICAALHCPLPALLQER